MAITVDSFMQAASLNIKGELEVKGENVENLGTTTILGTIGNQIVRFFQTIGAFLGICQKPPNEQERQAKAINAFREALTKQYGAEIAQSVTQNLTGRLNWMRVIEITTFAKYQIESNARYNEQQVALMLPGEYVLGVAEVVLRHKLIKLINDLRGSREGKTLSDSLPPLYKSLKTQQKAMEDFKQLCREAGVKDENLGAFTALFDPIDNERDDNAHTLYREMLRGVIYIHSHGNNRTLTEDEVRHEAHFVLKPMQKMEVKDIVKCREAFKNLTSNIKDVLSQIANGCNDTDTIRSGVTEINGSANKILADFHLQAIEEGRPLYKAAIGNAFSELELHQKKALRDQLCNWRVDQNPFKNAYDGKSPSSQMALEILPSYLMEIVGNDGKGHVDGISSSRS